MYVCVRGKYDSLAHWLDKCPQKITTHPHTGAAILRIWERAIARSISLDAVFEGICIRCVSFLLWLSAKQPVYVCTAPAGLDRRSHSQYSYRSHMWDTHFGAFHVRLLFLYCIYFWKWAKTQIQIQTAIEMTRKKLGHSGDTSCMYCLVCFDWAKLCHIYGYYNYDNHERCVWMCVSVCIV